MTRDMSFIIVMIYRIQINTIQYNDLALIKMAVARFVGTGSFLIRYYNGHTKRNKHISN